MNLSERNVNRLLNVSLGFAVLGAATGIVFNIALFRGSELSFAFEAFSLGMMALGAVSIAFYYMLSNSISQARRFQEIERRVKHADAAIEDFPNKTRPVWEAAQSRLEGYFERNLFQVRWIFPITALVMLAGFGLIVFGIASAREGAQLEVAWLAAVSGLVTEFIGATFLVIYKSAMTQASDYVRTLERINAVGMALQVLDTIPDSEAETKNSARLSLVAGILATTKQPAETPQRPEE